MIALLSKLRLSNEKPIKGGTSPTFEKSHFWSVFLVICYFLIFSLPQPICDLPWFSPSKANRKIMGVKWWSEMQEGGKISKSNIWPIVLEMVDFHIKCALNNSKKLHFHFYGSWRFPFYKFCTRCCIKCVNSIESTWNSLAFRHPKRFNTLKNTGATKLLPWAQWRGVNFL